MGEIIVAAGFLSVLFLFFWLVVVCIEKLVKNGGKEKEEKKSLKKWGVGEKEVISVIAASIVVYEEGRRGRVREKRVLYEEKQEKTSLWRVAARNRQ